ncbi:MAG: hypothetical protein ABEJ69_00160 [Candidatus Nanohaloarchaea archaeon]
MVSYSRKTITVAGLVIAALIAPVLIGIPMFEAEGTCYTKHVRCHGLVLDGCNGFRVENYDYVDKQQCEQLDNITRECNELGEKIASVNNHSIGTRWAPKTAVAGKSCAEWNRIYGINLTEY